MTDEHDYLVYAGEPRDVLVDVLADAFSPEVLCAMSRALIRGHPRRDEVGVKLHDFARLVISAAAESARRELL